MNYVVIELQTNNGATSALVYSDPTWTWNQACSVYFNKLSAAAISSVDVHSVTLLSEDGEKQMSMSFDHRPKGDGEDED